MTSKPNFKILKFEKSESSVKRIADFLSANEFLLPDPISVHVDIISYAKKLNTLGECWGLEKEGKLVGFCGGYINDYVNKKAYLQLLLISKECQNLKGGSTLIEEFKNHSIKNGFLEIQLTVDLCNEKAIRVYNKIGFFISKQKQENPQKQYMILSLNNNIDLPRVQQRLQEMGKIIASILEKNNIPYIITFGTLLGAVRHGGFIPWDDDFDIFLFDDTYESALDCLRKELPSDLFLEDTKSEPLFFHGWAHVKDLYSEVYCEQFPQDNLYSHHGLSLDLYRCKKMKLSDLYKYRADEALAYLNRKLANNLITKDDVEIKFEELLKRFQLEELSSQNSNEEIFGMALNERYMKCDDVFPLKKYAFGNESFYGPHNADSILTHFYGKYMELPKEENRIPHYSKVLFKNRNYSI